MFTVLRAVEPPATRTYLFDRMLPFELEILNARIRYWSGDHVGHLDALNALLRKCRARASSGASGDRSMWTERSARLRLIIASQLIEMKVDVVNTGSVIV